jgi:hypothetical protein
MTKEEARVIFKSWQDYMEIADKFFRLFAQIPESFLPYPVRTLEEALNIVARDYLDSGNERMVNVIHESMGAHLSAFYNGKGTIITDEEAITNMKDMLDLIEGNPELKRALVKSLRESQSFWMKSRSQSNAMSES